MSTYHEWQEGALLSAAGQSPAPGPLLAGLVHPSEELARGLGAPGQRQPVGGRLLKEAEEHSEGGQWSLLYHLMACGLGTVLQVPAPRFPHLEVV